jgi:alpha-glucosidase
VTPSAPWWREAVTYEVYLRSFADSDGDGLGDLAGVRTRLPYLRALGVDALWLTPFYPSPDHDAGYDITDHRAVDPRVGDLAEVDALIAEAHACGLRVVIDVVLNHVSARHPWFLAAREDGPGSASRARFHVLPGTGPGQALPPNNWTSIFGGSAWSPFGDGEWHLHLFDVEQPDVNHEHPDVADDAERTLRCWLDRGVDGVRFDAAGAMSKDPAYPDLPAGWQPGEPSPWSDRVQVHDLYRRWAAVLGEYGGQRLGVAEVWAPATVVSPYLRPDEMGQAFAIDSLFLGLDAQDWRTEIDAQLAAATVHGRLPAWTHGNHDVSRAAHRWGADGARAVLLMMLALPGACYLFAGDELALPDVELPDAARRDPTFLRSAGADPGRDGCRVPLPWTPGAAPYGFGPQGSSPWLPQPDGWGDLSVERQLTDENSMLRLVKTALRLRRELWLGSPVDLTWRDAPPGCLAFRRGDDGPTCLVNFTDTSHPWTSYGDEVVLTSTTCGVDDQVPGRSTVWLR